MPNKTDRIISYLPGTFQKRPYGPTLHAVINPFGRELQDAENSLAAIMQAHWVNYADRGADAIQDLAAIAALYGLAPRSDEDVEAFREHLKRYVRTFLEGTVTVQGILRVAAEALGLNIADDYTDLDTWWTRAEDSLLLTEPSGADAAARVLGVRAAQDRGLAARAAHVQGTVDLTNGADLRETHILRLAVDGAGPVEIDLRATAADAAAVDARHIADNINAEVGSEVARVRAGFLQLTSPTRGPGSRLDVQDTPHDAAEAVLGLPPRAYFGHSPQPAIVRGTVDLSGPLDLTEARYLRLLIDGARLAELDVAGPDETHTLLDQVAKAINQALGVEDTVTHDGRFLTLTSPSVGLGSGIVFQQAAAQQAFERLFGPISRTHVGRGPTSARVVGRRDLSGGVDLSERAALQLRLDGAASAVIDCTGEDPTNTQLPELVAAINEGLGVQAASHNGRNLILTSPASGTDSEIIFLTPDGDAAELLFGIGPRTFHGGAATSARLIGTPDLTDGINLHSQNQLQLAVDGRAPITIDLRSQANNARAATLRQLADAIDLACGADVAATDGQHLILVSPTAGSGSSLEIVPLAEQRRARFVTRALVADEAAARVFGFTQHSATGSDALNARVMGRADLRHGVDLREKRYLRLTLDNYPPIDIDCAGPRPRATLLEEARQTINQQMRQGLGLDFDVASDNGRFLILSSRTLGHNSRIAFGPPRSADSLPLLLGIEPGEWRGQDATQVRFTGTRDLSQGVDLSGGDMLRLSVDGDEPVDIACAANAAEPAQVKLNEIVIAINLALGRSVASHNGTFLQLTSPTVGAGSRLEFGVPDSGDATQTLCGIAAPRSYHGVDASAARVTGQADLSAGVDVAFLRTARYLRIGVDATAPTDVDCLPTTFSDDPNQANLDDLVAAINAALEVKVASHVGGRLILTSPTRGQAGRIRIEPHSSGNARELLFGSVPATTTGSDAQPAAITGDVNLLAPVDLSRRSQIRLAVDGQPPVDIDVAGVAPRATFLDEIVDAINTEFPDLAALTPDHRLRLTAPSRGQASHIALLPMRTLDLIEYLPQPETAVTHTISHGGSWHHDNTGAAAVFTTATIRAPQGVAGPALVNLTTRWQVRALIGLGVNETLRLWRNSDGNLRAETRTAAGKTRAVPADALLVGPLGAQVWVPFDGAWHLSGDAADPPSLQLNNPLARDIVWLQARESLVDATAVSVRVTPANIAPTQFDPVAQDGQVVAANGRITAHATDDTTRYDLRDADDAVLADLRAGPGVNLNAIAGHVAEVRGTIHPESGAPLLIVKAVAPLFRVTLRHAEDAIEEVYEGVTIGQDPARPDALVRRLQERPSRLVRVASLAKASVLQLPQGRSHWRFLDCYAARFNHASFDQARFAGGICLDRGIFDVSRFSASPPEPVTAVFTSIHDLPDPPVDVVLHAVRYRPGTFEVRLPADLPAHFGGRFDEARFGQRPTAPELYAKAVTEPEGDDFHIARWLSRKSNLVHADVVPRLPLGWEAVAMPFRTPRHLSGGDSANTAQIFLAEEGLDGFLHIYADAPGAWGNDIAVAARASGPAMYDFTVAYAGAVFENGRTAVMGRPLEALAQASLQPGPVGVLQAKASGVWAGVSRQRTGGA